MAKKITRREFIQTTTLAGVGALALPSLAETLKNQANPEKVARLIATEAKGAGTDMEATFHINGTEKKLKFDVRSSLLDLLRERAGLTGAKKGCDHGQCGACTVIVDGKRINSCLSLAVQNQGKKILTIEGLASNDGELHPMQAAFVENDAYQCGYCTPGQIMSSVALLKEPCGHSDEEVRECMSGNICRCGAYRNILAAIEQVRGKGGSHGAV